MLRLGLWLILVGGGGQCISCEGIAFILRDTVMLVVNLLFPSLTKCSTWPCALTTSCFTSHCTAGSSLRTYKTNLWRCVSRLHVDSNDR